MNPPQCPRCKGAMKPGIATGQTRTASGDPECATVSYGGPGYIRECLKCSKCGHSITAPYTTLDAVARQGSHADVARRVR